MLHYLLAVHHKLLPAIFISLSFCGAASTLALDKPGHPAPAPAVKNTDEENGSRVAAETATAIQALGANPGTRQISAIVFKAVRSSPDSVLPIVNAAVHVSPKAAAAEIVTAAVAAVPNPWKPVIYHRKKSEPDYKGGPDGKSGPDGKQARAGGPNMDLGGRGPGDPGRNSANGMNGNLANGSFANANSASASFGSGGSGQSAGDPALGGNPADGSLMTLAEAIALTAFASQPGLSFSSLQAAVNIALLTDPATLLREVQSSRAISGVGDAGISNYANEPLRTPNPPVVSR